jgi:GDP-L-fucose synthase
MDVSKLTSLGWKASITLEEGVKRVFDEIKDRNWLG